MKRPKAVLISLIFIFIKASCAKKRRLFLVKFPTWNVRKVWLHICVQFQLASLETKRVMACASRPKMERKNVITRLWAGLPVCGQDYQTLGRITRLWAGLQDFGQDFSSFIALYSVQPCQTWLEHRHCCSAAIFRCSSTIVLNTYCIRQDYYYYSLFQPILCHVHSPNCCTHDIQTLTHA